ISASRLPSVASSASSRSTARSSAFPPSSFRRATTRESSVRSRMTSWARRLSSQKAGLAMSVSRAARRCSLAGTSKMPSELGHPTRQHVHVALEVAEHQAARFHARAASPAKPSVVGHVHDQAPATFHELADELREDTLVTDDDSERGWRAREDARAGARLELGDELGPAPDESDQSR